MGIRVWSSSLLSSVSLWCGEDGSSGNGEDLNLWDRNALSLSKTGKEQYYTNLHYIMLIIVVASSYSKLKRKSEQIYIDWCVYSELSILYVVNETQISPSKGC